ncbi:DUF1285 domain-containing protein [Endozoicomonas sp.]|uniref:DUF1285 domain-containing protein n=1 Tax=Endozoicomonas sp. TaxID=1892382 RepID=UPI00383B02A1
MTKQSLPGEMAGDIANTVQSLPKHKGLPPVHSWNPPFCGDIDMRICRDGRWLYNGSVISRESMVRLFSTVLRYDDDGCYYLVTPVEKVRIQVDDAPFIVTEMDVRMGNQGSEYRFRTSVGDEVVLNSEHNLWVEQDPVSGEPAPYIRVRDQLDALIHRNVFYELVERAAEVEIEGQTELIVTSQGQPYSLGRFDKE